MNKYPNTIIMLAEYLKSEYERIDKLYDRGYLTWHERRSEFLKVAESVELILRDLKGE